MTQLRRVEREENGQFVRIAFADLKTGDRFKLYDDCENPIESGDKVYTALTDPAYAHGSGCPEDLFVQTEKDGAPSLVGA